MKKQFARYTALTLILTIVLSLLFGCAHSHEFGEWKVLDKVTCDTHGREIRVCGCGEFEDRDIAPLGHQEGDWVTVKEATEIDNGIRQKRCELCGALLYNQTIPKLEMNPNNMPSKDREYTISIMTQRHTGYSNNDASDLWFFKYMEYWFEKQGYYVTINVQESNDIYQTKKLSLATDTMPDIFWGVEMTNEEVVRHAIEEGMILEWSHYTNETLMPNLTKLFAKLPESKTLSTAPNGGIYGIPYFAPAQYSDDFFAPSQRLYFRQSWLDRVGLQNPTTKDELLNVLRQFKYQITDVSAGAYDVPLVSQDGLLEKYLWTCMGFYGTEPSRFGSGLMMMDGELVVPAYSESYRDFVTIMKTMYDEGLIAKDFFSHGGITVGNYVSTNRCGALCSPDIAHVGDQFSDIVCANPIPMGDVTTVDDIHVSSQQAVVPNYIWANSRYEEPRILAMLIDFIYSEEGAQLYYYGPEKNDPLGLVDGWFLDEKGNITNESVEKGKCRSMFEYAFTYLSPNNYVGLRPAAVTSGTGAELEFTDSVTGKTYTCIDTVALSHDTNDGHGQLITIEKWSDRTTTIHIPGVYLSSNDMRAFVDKQSAINTWIDTETKKFIIGVRPISEIEQFWKELEELGVQEYLELAEKGYADWLADTYE